MAPVYIVVEIQTYADGNVGHIVTTHSSLNEAESKFHQVLAAAAISSVTKHAAILMREEGFPLRHECYTHMFEEPADET